MLIVAPQIFKNREECKAHPNHFVSLDYLNAMVRKHLRIS